MQMSSNRRNLMNKKHFLMGVAMSLCLPNVVLAQDSQNADNDIGFLEEIIITAEKRAESLQSVAIAVTAFSGERFQAGNIVNVEDLAGFSPGFSVSTYNPVSPQPYIRGVGTNASSVGDDASVGVFVDEVYSGRAGGFRSTLFDIERVEVLRGPQGTLFGRNVAGGALNITTRNPGEEFEGNLDVTYGRFDLIDVRGGVTVPLSDTVSTRFALSYRERDGFVTNAVTGNTLRSEKNINLRGKLLANLTDTLEMLVSVDYSDDQQTGPAARGSIGTDLPTDRNPRRVSLLQDGFSDRNIFGTSAKFTLDTDLGQFVSVTAYREQDYKFLDDLVGSFGTTPTGLAVLGGLGLINEATEDADQFTQEFRFASTDDGPFQYTVGVYYFNESVKRFETFDSSPQAAPGLSRPIHNATSDNDSFAIFGQASYQVSEQFAVKLGARQTWDGKDFTLVAQNPDLFGFLTAPINANAGASFSNFSTTISLEYTPSDDLLLYASRAEGFKAGGFNGLAASPALAATPFNPELATNYEIGLKSELFQNRVRFNVAAFILNYDDLQNFFIDTSDPTQVGGSVVVANADAKSQGVEVELLFAPTEGLTLSSTYSLLDAKYKTFQFNNAIVGNNLTRAPKHQLSAALDYRTQAFDAGELFFRAEYSYQSVSFLDPENTPASSIPAYALVNARVGFEMENGLKLTVFGKNIFDKEYLVHTFDLGPFGFPIYAEPATWGVSLGYSF